MAEPKIDCLPHRFVAREVIRIEIDGEHTESVTFSRCDESLLRLRAKYSPLPLSQHPTTSRTPRWGKRTESS